MWFTFSELTMVFVAYFIFFSVIISFDRKIDFYRR